MPDSLNELAAAISAAMPDDQPLATLRIGTVTVIETTGSRRVQTDATGATWLSRDVEATMTVGSKVWILQQGGVWLVGGRLNSGGEATPIGVLQPFAGATAPVGWLLCDGSAVNRSAYAALFAVIGTVYGVGDGSTTFNVPNLLDRMPVGSGASYSPGGTGGAASVALSVNQLPTHDHGSTGSHTHSFQTFDTSTRSKTADLFNTAIAVNIGATTGSAGAHTHTSVGLGQSHENMPPYLAMPYIIRAS